VRERHIQFDLQDLQDISVFEAELCPAVWTTVLGRDGGTAHQGGACSRCRFAPGHGNNGSIGRHGMSHSGSTLSIASFHYEALPGCSGQ
jgi:hypothetical protein